MRMQLRMKRNIAARIIVTAGIITSWSAVFSQALPTFNPSSSTGQMPTNRDPRYKPPQLPEYQRRRLNTGAASLFTGGNINIEEYYRQQEERKRYRRRELIRRNEKDLDDLLEYGGEQAVMESILGRQFDQLAVPIFSEKGRYRETRVERSTTIFLLSWPITMGASLAIIRFIKSAQGANTSVLNNSETISLFALGTLGGAAITYYDYTQAWQEETTEDTRTSYLNRDAAERVSLKLPAEYPGERSRVFRLAWDARF